MLLFAAVVVLAWVMVGVGAAAQAITGFGFSLVSAPFLIAAYHAPRGIQTNLLLSVVLNVFLVGLNRHSIHLRSVLSLLLPAAVATVAVGLALKGSAGSTWTLAAGAVCLAGTVVVWSGVSFPRLRGPSATAVVGALSGAMNVTTGVGGPPVVLFAVNARWAPDTNRATLQAYFLGANAIGLAILGLPNEIPIGLIVAVIGGLTIGHALGGRIPMRLIRHVSLTLAAIGSLLAIARGI